MPCRNGEPGELKCYSCTGTGGSNAHPDQIRIRGYYFPWGTKQIPYRSIRGYRRVDLSAARGRGRIWGTANPRYEASLDPGRPGKRQALVLEVGRFVRPLITPDDPDAVESAIRAQAHSERTSNGPAPIV
jgi:hypothetical protein